MLARSVRNPLIISLSTGIVFIVGSAPPVFAADDPPASPSTSTSGTGSPPVDPSDSPSADPSTPPSPPKPVLHVELKRTSDAAVHAGNTVSLVARVWVDKTTAKDVHLSIGTDHGTLSVECTHLAGLCKLGDVTTSGDKVNIKLTVPSKMETGTITLTGHASSLPDGVSADKNATVKVTKAPKPKSSKSSGSGSSGSGSESSSGSSSGSQTPTSGLGGTSGTNGTTPSTAPNNAVLPNIGQQPSQSPSTAPLAQPAGNVQSMRGGAEGEELTFEELASTQAAWLAALLVAFSLLLTQVRLGKASARASRPPKPKGVHRKIRRRVRAPRAL